MGEAASATSLPETLTLTEAFRAAVHLVHQYGSLESRPDEGLVLLVAYLQSDPARWSDWQMAVRHALADPTRFDLES